MLVLSRNIGECIDIFDPTTDVLLMSVMLTSAERARARIGIEADPAKYKILRRELSVEQGLIAGAAELP